MPNFPGGSSSSASHGDGLAILDAEALLLEAKYNLAACIHLIKAIYRGCPRYGCL
jgi:hypothetical protein